MAKGWSFGALTDALRSAAFVNTGSNEGEVMLVGTYGFGRKNIPIIASLDMANYAFSAGEMLYVNNNNITNRPAGMNNMTGSQAVRIQVIALADNTVTLLVSNGAERAYIITRNGDKSFATGQVPTSFNGQMDITSANVFNFGGTGGDNFTTIFLLNRADSGKKAYIQYDGNSNNLYISAGGAGRWTQRANGDLETPGRFYSSGGVSYFNLAQARAMHLSDAPGNNNMAQQGMHMGWSESQDGRGNIVVNKGGGIGGMTFRFVNSNNSVQDGGVTFTAQGQINASSGANLSGNLGIAWGGRGHNYQENGDIVNQNGAAYSIFQGYGSNNLNGALSFLLGQANDKINSVRLTNVRGVNHTNGGNIGALFCGIGDFGSDDGYGAVCDLQIYKNNAGWIGIGIG